ncbi:hypothetical protein DUNSADRAFT_262 [Dunaliella salina]|uniref:Cyclic nucleotide-binding domain-containing protein n=1 Tax=Dunaliella salina TaxID=3046 RepID=A0ABQ7FZ98_DUNSA|nr:hypothetical protein DUNSADRAFT_262 [Dunaliella salina]|eukprot:KAF5827675.1 hypothetical protein DUNSADRAFT_262 [Dunaliella salina]
MSSSNKIQPLDIKGVEDPSPPATTSTDVVSEPIDGIPKWEHPLEDRNSDRASWTSKGSEDDEHSQTGDTVSKLTSIAHRWLATCLPWMSSEEQAAQLALRSSKFVVHPHSSFYVQWYIMTVTVALLVAIFDPYNAAFVETAGMYPFYNFWAVTDYVATALLTADIILKFFLAYKDENNKCIITDNRAIAWQYLTSNFWLDLVVSIPVEPIVSGAMGFTVRDTDLAKFIGLLRWLRIGRMYHIFEVFATIQHKQILPPVFLTLARNYTYLFYIVHWMACLLFFIARIHNFRENTWFGRDGAQDRLDSLDAWADYLYSFYFSIGVFTGFSNEVFYKNNPVEAIVLCIYFGINVVAQAYILGTITVLLVKNDVESGEYRNAVMNLDKYLSDKKLPKSLQAAMHEHLELQSYSEKTADENILKHHPSTIKQKVLWHLYQDVLKDCYLLAGCTPQFLNLLLSVARMELFMPNVTITQQGDTAGDLLIIADGNVSVAPPTSAATDQHGSVAPSMGGGDMSEHGSVALSRGGGDGSEHGSMHHGSMHGSMGVDGSAPLPRMVDAMSNPPSLKQRDSAMSVDNAEANPASVKNRDSAMNTSTVKMTRFGGEALMAEERAKDTDTCIVIGDGGTEGKGEDCERTSAVKKNEGIMWSLLKGASSSKGGRGSEHGGDDSSHGRTSFGSASTGGQSFIQGPGAATLSTSDPLGEVPFLAEGVYTSAARTCSVTRVLLISYPDFLRLADTNPKDVSRIFRNLVKRAEKKLREVAKQAMDSGQLGPTTAQSLLQIAEGEPIESVSSIQLAGIRRSLTPAQLIVLEHLCEARRFHREDAQKHQSLRVNACLNAAYSGNTPKLQALLAEGRGRDASATDYDNRSALMLACRQNHEDTVEMLLKAGADTSTVDTMGFTALYEAVLKGNDTCISHLLKYNAKLGVEPRIIGPHIFQAISIQDLDFLRRLARVGADLDCTDLDGRTPLFLAASEGLLEVVILLVEEARVSVDAADSWGHTPEGDARLAGYHEVAQYLRKVQGSGKQPPPNIQSSFAAVSAQQAEEPSAQATDEAPHSQQQSGEHGHPARRASSLAFAQPDAGAARPDFRRLAHAPRTGRPSMDQKRQELRRSMRNRAVDEAGRRLGPSRSGARRASITPAASAEHLPTASSAELSAQQAYQAHPIKPIRPIRPSRLSGMSPAGLSPAGSQTVNDQTPTTPTTVHAFEEQLPTATSAEPAVGLSPKSPRAPAFVEQLPTASSGEPAGYPNPAPIIPTAIREQLLTASSTEPAGSPNPVPRTPTEFQEQLPTVSSAEPAAPLTTTTPLTIPAFVQQPPPISSTEPAGSPNLAFMTPTAFQEQLPTLSSAEPAAFHTPTPNTIPAFEKQPPPGPSPEPTNSASPRPVTPPASQEQPPHLSSTKPPGSLSPRPTRTPALQEQLHSVSSTEPTGSLSPKPPVATPAYQELPPLITPASPVGPSSRPSSRLQSASKLMETPSLGKPDVPRPPGTSPAGWVAFDGPNRPRSGTGTEQAQAQAPPQVASFLPETTGGNETEHSVVLPFVDPESLVAPPSLGKPDVPRPPGTSPAGWVAFDGADRPWCEPRIEQARASPPPQVGSFLPGTTEGREPGHSMVLPFVDPHSQVQQEAILPASEEGLAGSRGDGDMQSGPK